MGANWANRTSSNFYVYTLRYPDNTVFYVGKGIGNRIDAHEREARRGVISPKCDIIRLVWATGQKIIKRKEYEGLTQEQAIRMEEDVMSRYDFDSLANQMKRGNMKWLTPEWIENQRIKAIQTWERRKNAS